MTGSWYGAGMFGAIMGLLVMGGLNATNSTAPNDPPAREAEQDDSPTENEEE